MNKVAEIKKEYAISDSTVNCYGYRLLTEGYLKDEFEKNPVGFHMHAKREEGVLLKWTNLRVEGDVIYGTPVVNLSHPRGQQTVDEINNGFLNAASVGKIVVLEMSDDDKHKLPGQTGPTAIKWYNRECSLVDIPGNYNALTQLYDANNNPLDLADFTKPKSIMEKPVITAAQFAALNLADNTDQKLFDLAFNDLVAKANKVDALTKEIKDLKEQAGKDEVLSCLAEGLKDGKFTKEVHDQLAVKFEKDPKGLKDLVAVMPKYTPITEGLKDNKDNKPFGEDLADKTMDELMDLGVVEELKLKNPTVYQKIYDKEFKK